MIALAKTIPLSIVHQTGEKGLEATRKRYAEAGIAADWVVSAEGKRLP